MQGQTKTERIGNADITARELTVLEIRNWIAALEQRRIDVVGDSLLDEFTIADIAMMTDKPVEYFDTLTPSALRQIAEACREVNRDFFGMLGRIAQVGQAATEPTPAQT